MREVVFDNLLENIYAAHSKTSLAKNSSIYRYLQSTVGNLPDECAGWIKEQICDYDKFPSNLGKAIKAEFCSWLEKNPNKRAKQSKCPECSSDLTGWFWAREGQKRFVCKCSCNKEPSVKHIEAINRAEAKRRGYELDMQVNEFWQEQYENFKAKKPYQKPAGNWTGVIGHVEPKRQEHVKVLDEYNSEG